MTKEDFKKSSQRGDAEIRLMIDLYQSGLSMREVGSKFGISGQRVEQILKKAGIQTRKYTNSNRLLEARKRKRKILPKDLLLKYYRDEKLPVREILRRLKTNSSSLYRSLEIHKIPKRGKEGNHHSSLTEDVLSRLYLEENLTAREIARQLGYAAITVKKRLSKFGIRKGTGQN